MKVLNVDLIKATFWVMLFINHNYLYPQKMVDNTSLYNKSYGSFEIITKQNNVPVYQINLDEVPVDTLIPVKIISISDIKGNSKHFIGSAIDILAIKDTVLILDYQQSCIIISDTKGKIIGTIGRRGAGPVEFNQPFFLSGNDKYYMVYDLANGRIQFLNKKFKYVKSLPMQYFPMAGNAEVSSNYLFLNTPGSAYPHSIETYEIRDLSFKKSNLISKSFNYSIDLKNANNLYDMRFCVLGDNQIFAIGGNLPFAFCFDEDGKMLYALKFSGKVVSQLDRFKGKSEGSGA